MNGADVRKILEMGVLLSSEQDLDCLWNTFSDL